MKKMLMLASVASMIEQFNMSNIKILKELGYEVNVACNFKKGNSCTEEKIKELKKQLKEQKVRYFQIDFDRNVMKIHHNIEAYRQVVYLCKKNQYDFIHCHSPIGGVVGRLAAYMTNIRIIYTAHGFHFFKGAPLKNWLIYYPIEKYLSRFTDVLITINQEDFHRAKNKFHTKKIEYVPGVGIDINKFRNTCVNVEEKKKEFGIKNTDIILLSVGELNKNKNHEVVIRALAKLQNQNFHYIIAGQGELKEYLEELTKNLGIQEQVHIIGFRTDVFELYKVANIFVFPSFREGLSVALMEAMSSGLPCICSKIRGNSDLIKEGKGGYLLEKNDAESWKVAIGQINEEISNRMGEYNLKVIEKFSDFEVVEKMKKIYTDIEKKTEKYLNEN